jgi:L-ribulose-5-phosphate 3-epimerase
MKIGPHDLAVCSWSLNPSGMEDLVNGVRELGLSHVQLALAPLLFLDDKQKYRELGFLRNSGVTLTAAMIGFPGEDYATIPRIRATGGFLPDETWSLRRQLTIQAARLANELDIKILTTHVGFIPQSNHADYPKLLGRVVEVGAALGEQGVTLAMETGQETASELLQFLNDLPRHNVTVNFDPANMILYGSGNPIEAIRVLDRHIVHVHVKDAISSAQPGVEWGRTAAVGQGEIDWAQFLLALKEVGYIGPLAIEQESGKQRLELVREAIKTLETVVE